MLNYTKTWIAILATLTSLILSCSSADACTYSSFPQELGRDFVVEVTDRGRPVAGLQIELSTNPSGDRDSRTVKVVATDANGLAAFGGVKPGGYFVGTKQPAFRQNVEIKVVKKPKPGNSPKVYFDWPGRQALSARTVSGVLNGDVSTGNLAADFKPPLPHRPVVGAKLTLANLVSGEVVSSTMTTQGGRFDFGGVSAGHYWLRVEKPTQSEVRWRYPEGYLLVEVDSASQVASLDILLGSAICGELGYQNIALATSIDEAVMPIGLGLGDVDCSTEAVGPNLSLSSSTHIVALSKMNQGRGLANRRW